MDLELKATYDDVRHDLTAPGAPFETETVASRGRTVRAFAEAAAGVNELWSELARLHGERVMTFYEGESLTYGQVDDLAGRLAGALRERHDVGPGDRVAIAMANRPEYFVAILAAARLGAVAVMLNSRELGADLARSLARTQPRVVVADSRRAALLADGDTDVPVLVAGGRAGPTDPRDRAPGAAGDLLDLARDHHPVAAVADEPDAPAWILFTSGTSGTAKGAVLTHRNIANLASALRYTAELNLQVLARVHGLDVERVRQQLPPASVLLIFPLFHISGLTGSMGALLTGGSVTIMPRWDPARAAELCATRAITQVSGPPMVLLDLLELPDVASRLGSVRSVGAGGQATPPHLTSRLRDVVPAAVQGAGWGMTEVSGGVASVADPLFAHAPGAVGQAHPIIDVRAVDGDEVLSQGEIGELQVRGALVMAEYWDAPEATSDAFCEEWYRTGDVGRVDEHGLIHILDRKKDMVISAGENVYCAEVETALVRTGLFSEVAVFGVPDARLGERVVAAVTPLPGVALDECQVQALAGQELAAYKVPSAVVFDLGPLPRNGTGKLLKAQVRKRYLDVGGGVRP